MWPEEKFHEAYIPAKQSEEGNEARISCPQVHSWRSCRPSVPPSKGTPQAECVISPVTRHSEFAALRSRGQRTRSRGLRMSFVPSVRDGEPVAQTHQVAFAISRKFGNAVERNRARRRLRAAFSGLVSVPGENPPPFGLYLLLPSRSVLTIPHRDVVRLLQECFDRLETADFSKKPTL